MTKDNEITVFPNPMDLFQFAASDFEKRAIDTVNKKGIFSVVLSGGNTPKLFYDILTSVESHKNMIPWQKIQFFFGDERYLPAEDINNNYHMAQEYLFSKVPVNPENIFRIPTEYKDPQDSAISYEKKLREVFHLKANAFPHFDLVYLGLGDNAHTASLMPLSDLVKNYAENPLQEKNNQLVASIFISELDMYRITLTPPAINHGLNIVFLVTGSNKATAVWNVLEAEQDPMLYPAQLIHCMNKKTTWYLDQAAAEKLNMSAIR